MRNVRRTSTSPLRVLASLPTICEFYGISILLFFRDIDRHKAPHFHARYGGHEAVFSIPDAEVLAGVFPRKQTRLVQAWAAVREAELEQAWQRAVNGEHPGQIEPLR
jgi:hypothetical protein